MNDPPIFEFSKLKPITMTVTSVLNVKELDLSAIFCFLPVTNQELPMNNFRRKQGKIQLPPELNRVGEIISMRWNGEVRGIVRSDKSAFFPHSIIMDVGTSSKIVSYKLGKTIEVTGATSTELVEEASELIFKLIRNCQTQLQYIRKYPQLNAQIQSLYLQYFSRGISPTPNLEANGSLANYVSEWLEKGLISDQSTNQNGPNGPTSQDGSNGPNGSIGPTDEAKSPEKPKELKDWQFIAAEIWKFYYPHFYIPNQSCIVNMIKGVENYKGNLYEDNLSLKHLDSHMVNIASNLGYTVNQSQLTEVMNHPPFEAKFSNVKNSSPVKILYHYQKVDNTTGKITNGKQTITVNKGGYVKMSGPTLAAMEPVYYTFLKLTLENYEKIRSFEEVKSTKIKITGSGAPVSLMEIQSIFKARSDLKKRILSGQVPMIKSNDFHQEDVAAQKTPGRFLDDDDLMGDDFQSPTDKTISNHSLSTETQDRYSQSSESMIPVSSIGSTGQITLSTSIGFMGQMTPVSSMESMTLMSSMSSMGSMSSMTPMGSVTPMSSMGSMGSMGSMRYNETYASFAPFISENPKPAAFQSIPQFPTLMPLSLPSLIPGQSDEFSSQKIPFLTLDYKPLVSPTI